MGGRALNRRERGRRQRHWRSCGGLLIEVVRSTLDLGLHQVFHLDTMSVMGSAVCEQSAATRTRDQLARRLALEPPFPDRLWQICLRGTRRRLDP